MECSLALRLPPELISQVYVRSGWRIRDLAVDLHDDRAVLRGRATTHFARQLAQHAVQDLLPDARLENIIAVENPVEVLCGIPFH
jgi:hypothetical protein